MVKELFSQLFSPPHFESILGFMPSLCHSETAQVPFGEAFANAEMHFNHFIKPQEQALLTRAYLLLYLARGAAALGANCQPGFDAAYPFLFGGEDLVRTRVGFILVQVKLDSNVRRSTIGVFPNMDPFKCGILNSKHDLEDGHFPIPIIHLLFLLAQKEPSVKRKEYTSPSYGATHMGLAEDGHPIFTSYDIMCSGLSPAVFKPVEENTSAIWAALAMSRWNSLYSEKANQDVVRAQLPGCGSSEGHWSPWVEEFQNIIPKDLGTDALWSDSLK
jgi:hypothetical protein